MSEELKSTTGLRRTNAANCFSCCRSSLNTQHLTRDCPSKTYRSLLPSLHPPSILIFWHILIYQIGHELESCEMCGLIIIDMMLRYRLSIHTRPVMPPEATTFCVLHCLYLKTKPTSRAYCIQRSQRLADKQAKQVREAVKWSQNMLYIEQGI